MTLRWFVPSHGGDFRLEAEGEDGSILTIEKATLVEQKLILGFLRLAEKKGWFRLGPSIVTGDITPSKWGEGTTVLSLKAPVTKLGPILVRATKPHRTTLTAVKFADGKVETVTSAEPGALERIAEKADKAMAKAAASVSRPTPSCPQCTIGEVAPAGEVLREFLTPEQHADWAEERAIIVEGGITGFHYLLAHRNTPLAARIGRICYDLDNRHVVHFHNRMLPPEEEVLAAKLILEHAEPWLRNEATVLNGGALSPRFKNPFGGVADGVWDASFTMGIGLALKAARPRVGG